MGFKMLYKEFYREPVAELLWHSPIILSEIASRNCYDSYFLLDIDFVFKNTERFFEMFHDNPIIVRFLNMVLDIKNNISCDDELFKSLKPTFVKELLQKRPDIIVNESKPNVKFIRSVGIDKNHASVLEHIYLSFRLEFPRNVLQEISRHRIGVSPSVKSTRYTLTTLKKKYINYVENNEDNEMGREICNYLSDNYGIREPDIVNMTNMYIFKTLKRMMTESNEIKNDYIKNVLPEHWWTVGHYTMNLRSFKHMMDLRLSNNAFYPFRRLCYNMYKSLPEDIKMIFSDDYSEIINNIDMIWENDEV